eukprot:TRINITY_DN24417_c0_g3_i1.p1 TRINITY_DN24417_c0_g3~~TRINITY_DN24417_c0_g3_i1.p1  ORF type:complete len:623 (+),score=137.30 TRINITY_DN24417_c0_g3_i1:81-1949(+)
MVHQPAWRSPRPPAQPPPSWLQAGAVRPGLGRGASRGALAPAAKRPRPGKQVPEAEEEFEEVEVEEEDESGHHEENAEEQEDEAPAECGDGQEDWALEEEEVEVEEGFTWDGEEAEEAAFTVDLDLAFQEVNAQAKQDESPEKQILARLRRELVQVMSGWEFVLEPFGSYVTDLGLPHSNESTRSDLDVVLLFRGQRADSFEAKDVRTTVVNPTIDTLGRWLQQQPGITVKNIIRHARVPIVTFQTEDLEVDISVQQPFGVLNSWHLRDLCASGWPGRLSALVRLVKLWAKSKAIHTAKDGSLSSYGWAMLSAGFLQDSGGLPAILKVNSRPYLTGDEALRHVLGAGSNGRPKQLWDGPQPLVPDGTSQEEAMEPAELFTAWLRWLQEAILPGGEGSGPLHDRRIVSVRGRTQEELRADVTWCTKNDHWSPSTSQVCLLIEEPLTGENVARCVRLDGFRAIQEEVDRALEQMSSAPAGSADATFKAMLRLPPLTQRQAPPDGVGMKGKKGKGGAPAKGGRGTKGAPGAAATKGSKGVAAAAAKGGKKGCLARPWAPATSSVVGIKRPLTHFGGGQEYPPAKRRVAVPLPAVAASAAVARRPPAGGWRPPGTMMARPNGAWRS